VTTGSAVLPMHPRRLPATGDVTPEALAESE
jgi:hypothetical protein